MKHRHIFIFFCIFKSSTNWCLLFTELGPVTWICNPLGSLKNELLWSQLHQNTHLFDCCLFEKSNISGGVCNLSGIYVCRIALKNQNISIRVNIEVVLTFKIKIVLLISHSWEVRHFKTGYSFISICFCLMLGATDCQITGKNNKTTLTSMAGHIGVHACTVWFFFITRHVSSTAMLI